ncbi:MAG: sugar transferase [Myxococcales bacterium]|nr:sugar transferase [Myxococcales bacterium]
MKRSVIISSCVGGGPMERLARELNARGVTARVGAPLGPAEWRDRMSAGRGGRLRGRLQALLGTPLQALRDAFREDAVLVPTTNPFFLPAFLVATRFLHGRPVVPLVYDLYPDALEAGGVASSTGLLAQIASASNRFTFRNADAVVFIGHGMGEHARARYGAPRRWAVLETGADANELDPVALAGPPETELERFIDGKLVISYVGNAGHVHDVETLAAAVPALLDRRPSAAVAIVIAASGPGAERLRAALGHLAAVRIVPPLADRDWARLLVRTHISIATLKPAANRTSIPSKALSAMGAGAAILAIAPGDSDLAALVTRHQCGWLVAPGDVEGAVAAITDALDRPTDMLAPRRRAARAAVVEHYDLKVLAARWERLLADAARREAPDPVFDAAQRALDLVVASTALLGVGPVLALGAIATRLTAGAPVLFRQERPGQHGRPFAMKKFRSMRDPKAHETGPEFDAVRLTGVGKFMRATSIDELPTLLSVLAGDMSLVGPRPLLMRYLPRYTAEQHRRHEVRPGVTGWAQVNGRNALSWEEKFAHDVWYVEHRSLLLDLRILMKTVAKVLFRDGVSQEGHATMPEFMGSPTAEPSRVPPAPGRPGGAPPGHRPSPPIDVSVEVA